VGPVAPDVMVSTHLREALAERVAGAPVSLAEADGLFVAFPVVLAAVLTGFVTLVTLVALVAGVALVTGVLTFALALVALVALVVLVALVAGLAAFVATFVPRGFAGTLMVRLPAGLAVGLLVGLPRGLAVRAVRPFDVAAAALMAWATSAGGVSAARSTIRLSMLRAFIAVRWRVPGMDLVRLNA
jgi:hypothetical protein